MSQQPAAALTSDIQTDGTAATKIDPRALVRLLVILLIVSFLLRIVYARFLFEDDGLWFTAGQQILRGKVLYRDIYFDKPPLLPLLYAGLFYLFGAHLLTIRLFTCFYVVAVSAVLYVMAFRLYGKREALISASVFTVFSTCFVTGHAQGLNTDFLMTLPYSLGAYLFVRSVDDGGIRSFRRSAVSAFCAGIWSGLAFETNPKGIFDLAFFIALLAVSVFWSRRESKRLSASRALALLVFAMAGFALACAPFMVYITSTGSYASYVAYLWTWGTRYARYYPLWTEIKDGIRVSAGYFAVNNLLIIALALVVVETVRLGRKGDASSKVAVLEAEEPPEHPSTAARGQAHADRLSSANRALLLWLVVSYSGLAIGGRFFSHYFFEILPALSAIAGRGVVLLSDWVKQSPDGHPARIRAQAVAAIVLTGFGITLARFHVRTVTLAVDAIRGRESEYTKNWYYAVRNEEERRIAAAVAKSTGDFALQSAQPGPHQSESRGNSAEPAGVPDPEDYLFVWGYRPEIYFFSGLIPASKFLSTQPLTGVPADVQYENWNNRSLLSDAETAAARQQLVRDLSQIRPKFIVDEAGMFNLALNIGQFPELKEFMRNYKKMGATGLFMVYRRRDFSKKWRRKHPGQGFWQ